MEDQVYLSLALFKMGDKENARKIYAENIRPNVRMEGGQLWVDKKEDGPDTVKTAGTIGVLAAYLEVNEDADAAWNYISSHDPEKDLDTVEELLLAKYELGTSKATQASFSYQTGARNENVSLDLGGSYSVTMPEDELKTMKFDNIKGDIMLVSYYEINADPDSLPKNNELSLKRRYFVKGEEATELKDGDMVLVKLDPNIATNALDGAYQVIDHLPSGLKPLMNLNQGYANYHYPGIEKCDYMVYPDKIVDNSVYFSFGKDFEPTYDYPSGDPNKKVIRCSDITFNYFARVVSGGTYKADPAMIQSLSNMTSLNISAPAIVQIK
jgi:hypothetical protein